MKTGVIGQTGQRKFARSYWRIRIKDGLPSVCTRTAHGMSQNAESVQLRLLRRDRREIMYDSFIEIWEG